MALKDEGGGANSEAILECFGTYECEDLERMENLEKYEVEFEEEFEGVEN